MRDRLFSDMLGVRLNELAQGANPPFVSAAADRELLPAPRTREVALLQAIVSNNGVTRGLAALVTELQRLRRFGFTATELARAKEATMLGYERAVTESPDRESASRADEYARNFLQGEALPTIWQELAFHRRFLSGITLAQLNKLTGDWFPANNRLVVVAAPEAAGVVLPDERQLAAAVSAASGNRLTAYVDTASGQTLMDSKPVPGAIVNTTEHPEAGITEWTLSNGATVVLKPTTLRADEVVFNQAIAAALGVNNLRRRPQTPATIDQWDLAKSLAFYKARFADAGNFTFVFAGSFTPGTIQPLVETYLASLPAIHARETWRDLGITP